MYKKLFLLVIIVFFCIAWSNDPSKNTPVCTLEGDQFWPEIISNGSGGTIILWLDRRDNGLDIYAQQYDSKGNYLWEKNGVAVCTPHGFALNRIETAADGSGGAILTWPNELYGSDSDIYVQGIDTAGKKLWKGNGVAACTARGDQSSPRLVSDGSGGAIIAWLDKRNGNYFDVYAQRVDAGGNTLWQRDGVSVFATGYYSLTSLRIIRDGSGGAIIAWIYKLLNIQPSWIFLQRIDSSGIMLWGEKGIVLQPEHVVYHEMVADGTGGVIITYLQRDPNIYPSNTTSVFAQRIDEDGTVHWDDQGILVADSDNGITSPHLVPDGYGGAIISWKEARKNIYARRIDAQGNLLWDSQGAIICTDGGNTLSLSDMAADGNNGAIIVWKDGPIYVQRLNPLGEILWPMGGVRISTSSMQNHGRLAVDPFGGAVLVWHTGVYDIPADVYAQNICADGKIGNCSKPIDVIDMDKSGKIVPRKK